MTVQSPPVFYEVDVFGPPRDGLWILCPPCLHVFERAVQAHGRGSRVHIEAELPANEDEPRRCSNCERPQIGFWSFLECAQAEWDAGERAADADYEAHGSPF